MKLGRLNHIGVVVPDMDEAIAFWRDVMGATSFEDAHVEQPGLKIVFVNTPTHSGMDGTQIELIQPLNEDTAVSGFLAKNPSGGQHHVCFEVPDIAAHLLTQLMESDEVNGGLLSGLAHPRLRRTRGLGAFLRARHRHLLRHLRDQ